MVESKAPNPRLAARIDELGLSQAELAELINAHCAEASGRPGTATDRYVRQLLDGTISWPRERYRRALEAVLGRTALELGFVPRGKNAVMHRPTHQHSEPHRKGSERSGVIRRDFLRLATGVVVSVALPDLPARSRISMADVHSLRENLGALVSLDQQYGGGAVAEIVMQHARRMQHALQSCYASERVERALYSVVGTYAAEAGWLALDANNESAAREYASYALHAAMIARDPMLDAEIWNLTVLLAHRVGNHAEALAVARAALDTRFVKRNPKLHALFLARAAGGYAQRGDAVIAEGHTGRAFDALARDDGRVPPPWLSFLDEAELKGLAAVDQLDLGQFARASESAHGTLVALRSSYTRNRLYYTLLLAQARLGARQVDAACVTAHEALDLATVLRSNRTLSLLKAFDDQLTVWNTPEARAWRERFATQRAENR